MPGRGGISGLAVGMAAAGAFLVYAGVRGGSVREGLRSLAGGTLPHPQAGSSGAVTAADAALHSADATGTTGSAGTDGSGAVGAGAHQDLARAALARRGEQYSQAKRWQQGFSDCSSFVGKCLRDIGIEPPGASVTGNYLVWSRLRKISRAEVAAGDLLCGVGHIAIALDNTTAIGQQNSKTNVRVGPIESIMYGQTGWYPQRLT